MGDHRPSGALVDSSSPMARYREAYEAMNAGHWVKARRLLLGLWNKSQTYDVAASLGQVEYQLLNFVSAARYMSFAIAHVAPKEKYANLERYRNALEEIRAWIGTLALRSTASRGEIRVDGEVVGHAPFEGEIFVAPGTHVLELAIDADRKLSKRIAIAAGERLTQVLEFPSSKDEAELATFGSSPAMATQSSRDRRRTTLRNWTPAYVGAGLAGAGALVAAGFGLAANSAESDADDLRARVGPNGCTDGSADPVDCRAAADAVGRQRRAATLSTIGVGVAVVAGTATLAYIVFWPAPDAKVGRDSRREPALALEAGAGSLFVSGTF